MPYFADRVKATTTTTGTGALTLSASGETGFNAFPSSLNGLTVGYVIESADGSDFEIGTGTYTHSSLNLTRTLRSSSTGSLLNLASGTHTVFLSPAAQDLQIVEVFSSTSDLPSATDYHGRIYHVHGEGAMYFAHAGNWVKLANSSDVSSYTLPTASSTTLGGVKVGNNLSIDGSGVLSASAGSSLTVQDEGSALSTAATALNFVGSGVTASGTGATKTITISGDSGGGGGGGGTVTSYANKAAIDAVSSPSEADLAFDEDKNVLYIRAGGAWERVQHGGNAGPRFTTTPVSTLALSSAGSTSTITAVAVDEAGFPVSYDWDAFSGTTVYTSSSLPNQITNVSESNGVFTLTPSTNSSHAGSFTFRTKASDGAQVTLATTTVSLAFSQDITTPNSSPFDAAGTNSFDVTSGETENSGAGFSSTLRTGKFYLEFVMGSGTSNQSQALIGLVDSTVSSAGYATANSVSINGYASRKFPGGSSLGLGHFDAQGDIVMMAYDTSTREVWLGVNGSWYEDPSTSSSFTVGTSSTSSFKLLFGGTTGSSAYDGTIITAGSGTFSYSIPSGFSGH